MPINLPEVSMPRIVIVGAGFAGLTLARRIARLNYQIVLIDKNNFHQFQPLFYQVAMSGLEPSAISFPLRKMFRRQNNVHIRMAEVQSVDLEGRQLHTDCGIVNYDMLVLAMGVTTNFFGNKQIEENVYTLKSVAEALYLRNAILSDFESSLMIRDHDQRQRKLDIVIVGGGPTGVELAGALAEMKRYIIPKEYPEMNPEEIDIHLIQAMPRLLEGMSEEASEKAEKFLTSLGVKVQTSVQVVNADGTAVELENGEKIYCDKVIWAAGVVNDPMPGIPDDVVGPGKRLKVDRFNRLQGHENIFVLGDQAVMSSDEQPKGDPQVAQGALQHAKHLAKNLRRHAKGKSWLPFAYKDLGSLATIGRNKAVADLPYIKMQGFVAWVLWLVIHLKSILGVKNKLLVLMDWIVGYLTYDQSLRIIIKHKQTPQKLNVSKKGEKVTDRVVN
jgi:NADH dehydrogenase